MLVGVLIPWGIAVPAVGSGHLILGPAMVAIAVVITWLFAVRMAHRVTVEPDGAVSWSSLLSGGSTSVTDLVRVRPARFERSMLVLEGAGGRGPFVIARPGLGALIAALRAAPGELPIDLGPWTDRLDRLERRGPRR